jgi:C-terminal processing protease CtpA/Prc
MKITLPGFFLVSFASLSLKAQPATTPDESALTKPVQPVLASQHQGPGRIGVRLAFTKDTGMPQIIGMIRGGPAADFGFKIGDVILKIDKNYTTSLTPDEIKIALHGEPGSGVELTVLRGDDPKPIVRAIARRAISPYAEDIVTVDQEEATKS